MRGARKYKHIKTSSAKSEQEEHKEPHSDATRLKREIDMLRDKITQTLKKEPTKQKKAASIVSELINSKKR